MTLRRRRSRLPRAAEKAVLIVLFVPSVDRDSQPIEQELWMTRSLELFGGLFGGATAFPKARGVWRDDRRGGRLVWDEPVIVHCYASRTDIQRATSQVAIGEFCAEMCRATNQGEVGLVIDNVYHAIQGEDPA
jgi:hypothetical protein